MWAVRVKMKAPNPESRPFGELIHACIAGDGKGWEEFVRRAHPVIASTAMRTARRLGDRSPETVEDLIQATLLRICANRCQALREFKPAHPDAIYGLLKTIALNEAHDHFRRKFSIKRGGGQREVPLEETATPPKQDEIGEIEVNVLESEIDGYLASAGTPLAERKIFWQFYREGLSSREIAELPETDLKQKGVESLLKRLSTKVRNWMVDSRRAGRLSSESKGKPQASSL
jgi:RNA polymerase sigma-70 factor (ECF subfamily)